MDRDAIVDAVQLYLDRPDLADTSVEAMVALVEGELNRELNEHPRNRTSEQATITAPVSANIPLPDDLLQLIRVVGPSDTIYEQYSPLSEPTLGYIDRGTYITVYPTPVEDDVFTLEYYAALPALDADDAENWVSIYHPDVYVYGVLKESAIFLMDRDRLPQWEREYKMRLNRLKVQGWDQNVAIVPRSRNVI